MPNKRKYPPFSIRKATEATWVLLALHKGVMDRLKLLKLLYLADRRALELWERPITYDTYYSMREGQVLSGVLDLINGSIKSAMWQDHIERRGQVDVALRGEPLRLQQLSRGEVRLLQEIHREFGHWDSLDLGAYTKKLPEYKPTTRREKTDIEEILRALFGQDDVDRIERALEDRAYLEVATRE